MMDLLRLLLLFINLPLKLLILHAAKDTFFFDIYQLLLSPFNLLLNCIFVLLKAVNFLLQDSKSLFIPHGHDTGHLGLLLPWGKVEANLSCVDLLVLGADFLIGAWVILLTQEFTCFHLDESLEIFWNWFFNFGPLFFEFLESKIVGEFLLDLFHDSSLDIKDLNALSPF